MCDSRPTETFIARKLAFQNLKTGEWSILDQSAIAGLDGPLVILGDPGSGKSVLTQELGTLEDFTYVRAGSFVRHAYPEQLVTHGERLVIDGLDEIASSAIGGGVEAVLAQLSRIGNPPFIISSREADWRGASDRIKIEDDYGRPATLLHLQPFDRGDATLFLEQAFPDIDATAVLDQLANRGLEDIYKNPLTLRLIGEVAAGDEPLPASRAQLLERACRVMLKEENPRHQGAAHTQLSVESLLLAAGAHAAAQLLCDRSGIFTGAEAQTPDGYVHTCMIANLPLAAASSDVLRTRLFQAEGETRFQPVHRVIAEYLGAKWLAACFEAGVSARRIFALFSQGEGVPTSLRGLHAWIAHFNDILADRCIAADPYAVLRYGDADTLPLSQARSLLAALKALSVADPYFRAEDWERHPAEGLMKTELKEEIRTIIETPEQHTHLTLLLLDAMEGTALTAELRLELESMMFDQARYFGERSRAANALRVNGNICDLEACLNRLARLGDEDSDRLAWDLLHDVGLTSVPMQRVVEVVLAHIGLSVSPVDGDEGRLDLAHISEKSLATLDIGQLAELLDLMRDYARPLMRDGNYSAKQQVADLVRMATMRALQLDPLIPAATLWAWIGWLNGNEGYSDEARSNLAKWLRDHQHVRRAIQTHVVLDEERDGIRTAAFRIGRAGTGLYLESDDVAALLNEIDKRRGTGNIDIAQVEEVVFLDRRREGISQIVRSTAERIIAGNSEFLAKLEEWSKPVVYEHEAKHAAYVAEADAKRNAIFQHVRELHKARAAEVTAGASGILQDSARAYLGRYSDFSRDDPPEARVKEFLGEELGERALDGFMATLLRDDLPSALSISQSHAEDKYWPAELAMVCGVAERLRRGRELDDLPRETLEAAFMGWRRCGASKIAGGIDIEMAFEAAALPDDAARERFFRTSIEPQLATRQMHVDDLYFLGHDARWPPLAGRLAIEWLERFRDLPQIIESELLECATRHGMRPDLRLLAIASRGRDHKDDASRLDWQSLDFLIDFDACKDDLATVATEHSEFLWYLRTRVAGERGDPFQRVTISQRAFIVERFGAAWPKVERPSGTTQGDNNPWDASAFIERMGYSIGGEPSAEATVALQELIQRADQSYADPLRHALSLQQKVRRDNDYCAKSIAQLQAVMTNGLPDSIDDMRAFFADRMAVLQDRMRGSNTDMWEAYWDGSKPRGENFCRNRLVEHISGQLPEAIRFEPEMHMPGQKRADIAAIQGHIGLPIEIKGQWHPEVWTAPTEQLAAKYGRDWHAEGRGAYIVLWFGSVPSKTLPPHPGGLQAPATPDELRTMLIDRLPETLRDLIDVYVVDVSRL